MEYLKKIFNFFAQPPIFSYRSAQLSVQSFKEGRILNGIEEGILSLSTGAVTICAPIAAATAPTLLIFIPFAGITVYGALWAMNANKAIAMHKEDPKKFPTFHKAYMNS